jgi:hypothetical protein
MMNASPTKDSPAAGTAPASAPPTAPAQPAKKKFNNGWTREIERLMAEWADKAICYRWMHEKTERIFTTKDMAYMFPVIILSTVTGAANFAMDSILEDPNQKKYAQLALGGLSIATGIISTIANRLGYASKSEAHHNAALLWGKFQRLIAIELSLHPNERSDCMHFLKMCRSELDRLIEQAPSIPDNVIDACRKEFSQYPKVRKPEIVGDIDTTNVFVDTNSRLKELAKEAAITLQQKKGVLKQIVLDDLEPRISRVIESSTLPAIRDELKQELRAHAERATREAVAAVVAGRVTSASVSASGVTLSPDVAKRAVERQAEVQRVAMSGVVTEMKRKLAEVGKKYEPPMLPGTVISSTEVPVPSVETAPVIVHVVDDNSDGESVATDENEGEGEGDAQEEQAEALPKK